MKPGWLLARQIEIAKSKYLQRQEQIHYLKRVSPSR